MANRTSLLIPLILAVVSENANAQPFDPAGARGALAEAQALCRADRGRLWGRDLCGPILIANPDDRGVFANQPDAQGLLTGGDGLFRGTLPAGIGIANTAMRWQGRQWTMLRWPLPADRIDRTILLIHESWHRIQTDLGLVFHEATRAHLATAEGRIALRLELRALAAAVELNGTQGRRALQDALGIRAWRHARFPAAAAEEAALELNEGLAEYTGWTVTGAATDRARLALHVRKGDRPTSLVRNFAYFTGPAYGMFLDRLVPAWKARLSARSTLTGPLPRSGTRTTSDAAFERIGSRYEMAELRREETEAARVRAEARARWHARLVARPTLTLPMFGADIVFDPNTVFPLDDLGNVYPRFQANGAWGRLDVTDGALLRSDWSEAAINAEGIVVEGREARTASWQLELAQGWTLQRDDHGAWRLVQPVAAR